MKATAKDIDTLARTGAGEARGETYLAQTAVAWVFVTRAALAASYLAKHGKPHPDYGDGAIAAACLAPGQADCWNASDPNRAVITALTLDDPILQRSTAAALDAILGLATDPTGGATHYWDNSIPTPKWAAGLPYRSIGNFKFVTCP